jgi:tetratricopeptide (TPR) repeat protein
MASFAEQPEEEDLERMTADEGPFLEIPAGGEGKLTLFLDFDAGPQKYIFLDWEASSEAKEKAGEAKANGDYESAVAKYTDSMRTGQVSAMVLANRAECLLKLRRPCAAVHDCNAALEINPDSAKAYRCRGKANRFLGKWTESTHDLSAAQVLRN